MKNEEIYKGARLEVNEYPMTITKTLYEFRVRYKGNIVFETSALDKYECVEKLVKWCESESD